MSDINIKTKNMSVLDVWGMAVGCMVGWGAFVMPGTTLLPVAGPLGTLISMVLGAVIMLVIGNNFAYLMNRSHRSGGVYRYTKEAFGLDHAFLSTWFLFLSYLTIVFLNGTALFIVMRTIFGSKIQFGFCYTVAGNEIYFSEAVISVAALVFVGLMFMFAKNVIHKLQTFLAIVMFVGVVTVAIICIPHIPHDTALFNKNSISPFYGIMSITFLAPWAYVGFDVVCFDTENFNFNFKHVKPTIFVSIIIAGIMYTAMAIVGVSVVPDNYASWGEYINALDSLSGIEAVPTFYAAQSVMGQGGVILLGITALAAVMTGIIGGYRVTIKVLTTMAEDKILTKSFAKTTNDIMFVMIISITLALLGRKTLSWFVDLTSFGAIVGFGYVSAAAYKTAKSEAKRKAAITGALGTIISVIFVVVQLVPRLTVMETMGSAAFLLLSLWCLLGFVFYWHSITKGSLSGYSGMSTLGVVLFALLLYSAVMWLAKQIVSKESAAEVHKTVVIGGTILLTIVFVGLAIMLYLQELVRRKHEQSEREKIIAVESSKAKSQFLFNMSHDIRTPMNAIIGYTDLALNEDSPEKRRDYLAKIKRSNNHLLNLINDILEMSRIENGKIELELVPTDLFVLSDDVKDLFEEQMKQKNMDFVVDCSDIKNRYVFCDSKNLNRVIVNLVNNAYKFTPQGGKVSAVIKEIQSADEGKGSYEIIVSDNGTGMSKEFAEKMFTPFEREKTSTVSKTEGTGLGLSICKSMVDIMGGTIDVETELGKGTTFTLTLSFDLASESDMPKNEGADGAVEGDKASLAGKRVLLVEDNMINMEIAKLILKQAELIVETAENGQIAVDMVSISKPGHYDVILMDVQMPVMDGYTAAKAIRALDNKALASIPILAMTANAFKEDEEAALAAGMQGHVAKPIDVEALMAALRRVAADNSV